MNVNSEPLYLQEQTPLKINEVQKHTFTVLSLDPLTILCMSTSVHVMAPVKKFIIMPIMKKRDPQNQQLGLMPNLLGN